MIALDDSGQKIVNQSAEETPGKLRSVGRANSKTIIQMSFIQKKLSFQIDNRSNKNRLNNLCQRLYFRRVSTFRTFFDFLRLVNTLYIIYAVPFSIAFINKEDK